MYIQEWQFLDNIQTFLWIPVILANSYRCRYWPVSLHLLCVFAQPCNHSQYMDFITQRCQVSVELEKRKSVWLILKKTRCNVPITCYNEHITISKLLIFRGCTDSFITFHYHLEELLPKRSFLLGWMHREAASAGFGLSPAFKFTLQQLQSQRESSWLCEA